MNFSMLLQPPCSSAVLRQHQQLKALTPHCTLVHARVQTRKHGCKHTRPPLICHATPPPQQEEPRTDDKKPKEASSPVQWAIQKFLSLTLQQKIYTGAISMIALILLWRFIILLFVSFERIVVRLGLAVEQIIVVFILKSAALAVGLGLVGLVAYGLYLFGTSSEKKS